MAVSWTRPCVVPSKSFDYIIVGSGTAGSVLANRLSACPNIRVLVLEAGGCPPFEADFAAYFGLQPRTAYDYNTTGVNDDFTCQNLQGSVPNLTQGKMLGGTSGISHMIDCRGAPRDYDRWANITQDFSWSYEALLPYFKRSEDVRYKPILSELGAYHGTTGPVVKTKQNKPQNKFIIEAYREIGYKHVIESINNETATGISEPLFFIGDEFKQNCLVSYICPAKDRQNLFFLTEAVVSKILFENRVAVGVQFTYNNAVYTVSASTEVIVSAGALRTPQLLILSGIGPADHLNSLGVPVISNIPVGQNLQDHVSSTFVIGLEEDSSLIPALNPSVLPLPVTVSYNNLNNPNASYAQCLAVNIDVAHDSAGFMQLCLNLFKYSVDICQKLYEANIGRRLLFIPVYYLHPESRGEVRCNSTDINDQPVVDMKYFTQEPDLSTLTACMKYVSGLVNTTAFREVGADIIDLGLCTEYTKYSDEYWLCYTVAMSCNGWDFGGTAAMASVVDTNLLVYGVRNLRVVDASVFPTLPGAKPEMAVVAVAEKISDVILSSNDLCKKKYGKCNGCQ